MDNATTLSMARIVIGAATWIAPEFSLKAAMLDPTAPQSPFMLRLFGSRDVALGLITLMAKPEHKPSLLKVGVAVDAGDVAAALQALRAEQVKPPTGIALAAVAGSAVVAGVVALKQHQA
jgi:hypothetical protein